MEELRSFNLRSEPLSIVQDIIRCRMGNSHLANVLTLEKSGSIRLLDAKLDFLASNVALIGEQA